MKHIGNIMRNLFIFIFIIFYFNAFAEENLSKNNITAHFNSLAVKGNFGKNSANLYTNEMFIFPKNIKEDTYFGPNNSFLIHKTINQLDDKSILYSHSLVMLDELGRRGVSKSCSAVYKKLDNNNYEYSGIVFCIPNEVSRVVYKNKFFTIESDKNLSASGYTTEYITFKYEPDLLYLWKYSAVDYIDDAQGGSIKAEKEYLYYKNNANNPVKIIKNNSANELYDFLENINK